MADTPSPSRVRSVLALGVLSVSFPAILIRYADAAPVAIAFWRKVGAALLLVPLAAFSWHRREWRWPDLRAVLPHAIVTGVLLAGHFTCWMTSVKTTTVASSLVLGSTGPVWAALLGAFFVGDRVGAKGWWATLLSLTGVAVIALGNLESGTGSLKGDLLAVAAAFLAAAYLTVGRYVRSRLPLAPWLLAVYAVAAAVLAAGCAASGARFTGFDGRTWLMFGLLALIPSTLGHNLLNYAVRHLEIYKVGLATLAEPVVSTILAAILFAEIPKGSFYPGALLAMTGVVLALWPAGVPPRAQPPDPPLE